MALRADLSIADSGHISRAHTGVCRPKDCLVCDSRIALVPGIGPKKLPPQHHLKVLCAITGSGRLKSLESSHPASPLVLTFCLYPSSQEAVHTWLPPGTESSLPLGEDCSVISFWLFRALCNLPGLGPLPKERPIAPIVPHIVSFFQKETAGYNVLFSPGLP